LITPEDDDIPPTLDEEYEAEIFRRIDEIESGKARMLSLEEVMASLRQRHQGDYDRLKADIDEGLKGQSVPAEQVFKQLRQKFGRGFRG
jgi:putative addiction module component (TIGR02574 family)